MKNRGKGVGELATTMLVATVALGSALMMTPSLTFAALETYKLDPEHTTIGFRVSHLVFSKVPGRFNKFEGTIVLDPGDLSKGTVEARSMRQASTPTSRPATSI